MHLSRRQRGALRLYGLGMSGAVPLLKRRLRRRATAEPGYALHPEQRLGHYPGVTPAPGAVWIHAVSLGETRAAAILLRTLRQRQPDLHFLLTHGTATGWMAGQDLLQPGDQQVWQPWDTPAVVQRFLQHFQPRLGLLLETEVWPHWVEACTTQGVPLYLVNARLSERSLRKALALPWLALPAYGRLHSVLAQTTADAARLRQLGAPVRSIMGNLKYDVPLLPDQQALGRRWRTATDRPVVLLASSREGEEAQWLQLLQELGNAAHGVQWLVVPRHPQRFALVTQLIEQAGWNVSRRSQWISATPPASLPGTVWLGDSLGEMQAYYHLASVAWLGGSFAPLGGQNLMEAGVCACPIVMGPHTFHFADAAQQAEIWGAARRVTDLREAWTTTQTWLADPGQYAQACQATVAWMAQGQGAARHCAEIVLQDLAEGTAGSAIDGRDERI